MLVHSFISCLSLLLASPTVWSLVVSIICINKNEINNINVYGIIDSMDMSLNKLWEIVKDREAWGAAVNGVTKSQIQLNWVIEQQQSYFLSIIDYWQLLQWRKIGRVAINSSQKALLPNCLHLVNMECGDFFLYVILQQRTMLMASTLSPKFIALKTDAV